MKTLKTKAKNLLKNEKRGTKGITLIALVVTIIVLLILAGVSIATLTGDNGLLSKAQEAAVKNEDAADLDYVGLAVNYGMTKNLTEQSEINGAIQEELRRTDSSATVTGDSAEKSITYKGKLYIVNVETGDIQQTSEEELAKKTLKIKVNTGDDGIVVLPIAEGENCTIDWGDGQTTVSTKANKEFKIASISNSIQLSAAIYGAKHEYAEKNVEETISITGTISTISSGFIDVTKEKILEIEQWGETGLEEVSLENCTNLTKIASPSENSFKKITSFELSFNGTGLTSIPSDLFSNCPDVTNFSFTFSNCPIKSIPKNLFNNCPNVISFYGTFSGCESLESIPTGLFDKCMDVETFQSTFANCISLEGYALSLWERVEGWENLDKNSDSDWYGKTPNGHGCYYGCLSLEGYSNGSIPFYWIQSPNPM